MHHQICAEDHFHGIASAFTINHTNEGMNKPKFIRFCLLLKLNFVKGKKPVKQKQIEQERMN